MALGMLRLLSIILVAAISLSAINWATTNGFRTPGAAQAGEISVAAQARATIGRSLASSHYLQNSSSSVFSTADLSYVYDFYNSTGGTIDPRTGDMYIANNLGEVIVYSTVTGRITGYLHGVGTPMAFDNVTNSLYMYAGNGVVDVVYPGNNFVEGILKGMNYLHQIVVNPHNGNVYFLISYASGTNFLGHVTVVSGSNYSVIASIGGLGLAEGMTFDSKNNEIYVASLTPWKGNGEIIDISTVSYQVVGAVCTSNAIRNTWDIAYSAAVDRLLVVWAGNYPNSPVQGDGVSAINPATGQISSRIVNFTSPDYFLPTGAFCDPSTGLFYISEYPYAVFAYNAFGGTVTKIAGTNGGILGFVKDNSSVYLGTGNRIENVKGTTVTGKVGTAYQYPYALAFDPVDNLLYVSNQESQSIIVINGKTNRIMGTLGIPGESFSMLFDPITNDLLVSSYISDSVTVVNCHTGTVIRTINSINFTYMAYDAAISSIVCESSTAIVLLNPATYSMKTVRLLTGYGYAAALDLKSNTIYLSTGNGGVTAFNLTSLKVIASIQLGKNGFVPAGGIAYDPQNGIVYVSNMPTETLLEIDPSTNRIIDNLSLVSSLSFSPSVLAFDPANGELIVGSTGAGSFGVFNTSTKKLDTVFETLGVVQAALYDSFNHYEYLTLATFGPDAPGGMVAVLNGNVSFNHHPPFGGGLFDNILFLVVLPAGLIVAAVIVSTTLLRRRKRA